MPSDATREAEDRRAIEALVVRYCTLVDSDEMDRIGVEIYTEDGVDEHGVEPVRGRDEITRFLAATRAQLLERCFHAVSNVVVELDGDRARAQSYVTAWHWLREHSHLGPGRPADWVTLGTFKDDLRREPEGWRIAYRVAHPVGLGLGTVPELFRDAHEAPQLPAT